MISFKYKNRLGTVSFSGGGNDAFRLTNFLGFGLAEREYVTADYSGFDGCVTVSSRFLPRAITISGDISGQSINHDLREAIEILSEPGYLYVTDGDFKRCIYCDRISFPDVNRILKGKIASFAIQFICDNPYFEDADDTVVALYSRTKCLTSPFTLPTIFSTTTAGATISINSKYEVEPILKIYFSREIEGGADVVIRNSTTGKAISLKHTPIAGESITIDVKNRTVTSSVSGNIINSLTDDTFLGDFVLVRGRNEISVAAGDVALGITVECRYNNKYSECVLI